MGNFQVDIELQARGVQEWFQLYYVITENGKAISSYEKEN